MKPGTRALGIAESYGAGNPPADDPETSTLAGVVTKRNGTVDGFSFGACTVGGLDSTDAVIDLVERLDRPDVRYLLVAGVALAWYNILDLGAVQQTVDRPVIAVTFEESEGLEPALRREFGGETLQTRLDRYQTLPDREPVRVDDEQCFVRATGLDTSEATGIVRDYTLSGGRPEPLRVARQAARAADQWRGTRCMH
jgi:endonuclease V-like protein UPF0215 family